MDAVATQAPPEAPAPLTDEERAEMSARLSQIAFYERTVAILKSERNLYVRHLLQTRGLTGNYALDMETGTLIPEE